MSDEKVNAPEFLGYFAGWYSRFNGKRQGHFLTTAVLLIQWMKDELEDTNIINIIPISKSEASFEFKGNTYLIQPTDQRRLEDVVQSILEQDILELEMVTAVFDSTTKVRLY